MNKIFTYEWHELTKGCRLTAKLAIQAIILAIIVGFGPDLLLILAGYGSEVDAYQFRFMAIAIPVVVIISILSYRKHPVSDITTSSLQINDQKVKVFRHVIAETGRRFYVIWESVEVKNYKIDEFHRVIQIDATWNVTAYRMKGKEIGDFVDSDIRSHPQTFQITPEIFYEALTYLQEHCFDLVLEMTPEEYEKARPFIHKHYEL